jgi:hypothetical protein
MGRFSGRGRVRGAAVSRRRSRSFSPPWAVGTTEGEALSFKRAIRAPKAGGSPAGAVANRPNAWFAGSVAAALGGLGGGAAASATRRHGFGPV